MSRTIIVQSPFTNNNELDALWPFPECCFNTSDVDFPSYEELLTSLDFAERTDGSPNGDGSGPFFVAHYYPPGTSPSVEYGGASRNVTSLLGTHQYNLTEGSQVYTNYVTYAPSMRAGKRILAYCWVVMHNDHWYNNELGYIPLESGMINAAGSSGRISGRRGGTYGPYPDISIRDDPMKVTAWLLNLVPSFSMNASFRVYWVNAAFVYGHSEKVNFSQIPFKYGEHAYYTSKAHPWASTPFSSPGSLHPGLFSKAFYNAQDSLPQLLSNTFQNMLEVGRTVVSLANGIDLSDLKNLRKLAGSSWLAYRYQYNTTLSDMEELESSLERFNDLSRAKGNITSYGTASDTTGTYHCAIIVDPKQILDQSMLKKMNLRPTLANAWDMIPYSFIVDWFTNTSELLGAIDRWLDSPSYGSVTCWYSYTNAYTTDDGGVLTEFFRYRAGRPLLPYWSMDYSHKTRTWAYRATDVVSLLL